MRRPLQAPTYMFRGAVAIESGFPMFKACEPHIFLVPTIAIFGTCVQIQPTCYSFIKNGPASILMLATSRVTRLIQKKIMQSAEYYFAVLTYLLTRWSDPYGIVPDWINWYPDSECYNNYHKKIVRLTTPNCQSNALLCSPLFTDCYLQADQYDLLITRFCSHITIIPLFVALYNDNYDNNDN